MNEVNQYYAEESIYFRVFEELKQMYFDAPKLCTPNEDLMVCYHNLVASKDFLELSGQWHTQLWGAQQAFRAMLFKDLVKTSVLDGVRVRFSDIPDDRRGDIDTNFTTRCYEHNGRLIPLRKCDRLLPSDQFDTGEQSGNNGGEHEQTGTGTGSEGDTGQHG